MPYIIKKNDMRVRSKSNDMLFSNNYNICEFSLTSLFCVSMKENVKSQMRKMGDTKTMSPEITKLTYIFHFKKVTTGFNRYSI